MSPAMTERPSDRAIAQFVEKAAQLISGAPFPSRRSLTKARELFELVYSTFLMYQNAAAPEGAQAPKLGIRPRRYSETGQCNNRRGPIATPPSLDTEDGWKKAIVSAVVVTECGPDDWSDPRKMIDHVINWHVGVALDPLVSDVARDAERYRWLRQAPNNINPTLYGLGPSLQQFLKRDEYLDRGIDAARAARGGG